jgi:acyl transferase domain-containing protein/acyl carrier protein
VHNKKEIQDWLISHIAKLLQLAPATVDIRESFAAYGLSSLDAVALSGDLEEFLECRLSPTLAYDYPTIASLSEHLAGNNENKSSASNLNPLNTNSSEPIAVIGMSCRFPGAKDPQAFWELLRNGIDAITEVPGDRWNKKAFYHPDPAVAGKSISYWGGFLENIDKFDPFFFSISPAEAKHMDPQQRLLLELSYEALDDAGQVVKELAGSKTGVFIGISINEYSLLQFSDPTQIGAHSGTGSALSIAANRISYTYNFHGPSIAVDTACSSSLAAVHLACQSLRNGECSMALAGGVNMILSPAHSIAFTKAGVLAPDGRCKSFDAAANGYVRGEGGGLVILKMLSSAIADGDPIQAVVLGSAMMQDGRTNGLIAPSSEAQENLLKEAYRSAGVEPCNVQYVEAHGTGTLLGDSMEAKAIGNVLGTGRQKNRCAIGSVKTNIGHLESAAGIAGLIKVILGLKHKKIPPSIHYNTPNPHIPFNELNLNVNNELKPWPGGESPSLAGVSSFGFGGTNVHVVVREAEDIIERSGEEFSLSDTTCNLFTLSATSDESLQSSAGAFRELISTDTSVSIGDICYAAGTRRGQDNCRLAIISNSRKELGDSLYAFTRGEDGPDLLIGNEVPDQQRKLVFVFSGQGGQWLGMGRELIKKEPVFYNAIKSIDQIIQTNFGWSLMTLLCDAESRSRLDEIDMVQPAIFAIQVALAELWRSWGIIPDAVTGHSMGEIAAAHVAGILGLKDAIQVVCYRSQLLKKVSGQGRMLATGLSKVEAAKLLNGFPTDITIAAINGPESIVFSGGTDSIVKMMETLEGQNIFCKAVNVDVASHSSQMDQLRSDLIQGLSELSPQSSMIPIYSSVTGDRAGKLLLNGQYWMDNIREPVLFSDAIEKMLEDGYSRFIEIGPHPVLLGSIQLIAQSTRRSVEVFASLRRDEPEKEILLRTLARLYTQGFSIDWKKLYPLHSKHVRLPMISWQRQRYWLDHTRSHSNNSWHHAGHMHPLLGERMNFASTPTSFIWQTSFDEPILNFLSDHIIGNEILFPAAGYIEMALQAASELELMISHTLCDVVFKESMVLYNEGPRTIQSILSPGENESFVFSIYSRISEKENWILHASAKLIKKSNPEELMATNGIHHDLIRQKSTSEFTAEKFYHFLQSGGIRYGPGFRGIQHIWTKGNESLGYISLPELLQYDSQHYQIHPALLDACLQVLAATQEDSPGHSLYLPRGCKQVTFFSQSVPPNLWSHVTLRSEHDAGTDIINADFKLYDNNDRIIAELVGFQLQRTSRHVRLMRSQQDIWLYQLSWQIKQMSNVSTVSHQNGKHWLILADDNGLGRELARQIENDGGRCHLVLCDETIKKSGKENDEIDVDLINKKLNETSSPLHGVIYLWGISMPTLSASANTSENSIHLSGSTSLIFLIQSLAKRIAGLPRLWIVTRGAQSVKPGEAVAVEQSTLWGVGKVTNLELPEFKCSCIDIDPSQSNQETITLLIKELSIDDREDQVAFRGGVRFVHRLLPFTLKAALNSPSIKFSADSTYLITGGLGALGLRIAEWMSQRGARHMVLAGRSKPSESVMGFVNEMRQKGIEIVICLADVSDAIQLQQVIDKIKNEMPLLRGVIHAAGVLDDSSLLNLNPARMDKVMRPKIHGAWNLHLATLNMPLDFFVLFSSAVSVLGSPGQGNYAAASAGLDAFAYYRRSLGLPAISINWGPWAEVGLAAQATERLKEENGSTKHLIKVIKIDRGLEILEQLITGSMTQVMVLPFDLKNLIELYPTAEGMPFLEAISDGGTTATRLYVRPKLKHQYVAPRNDVEHKLAQLWQQTLHIDKVGVHDSFFELGGDSVLGAQVLALTQKSFGIRIDPQNAFKAFTIEKLGGMLEEQIISKIEKMSEEEVRIMLSTGN